jgi:hypothetical protein
VGTFDAVEGRIEILKEKPPAKDSARIELGVGEFLVIGVDVELRTATQHVAVSLEDLD